MTIGHHPARDEVSRRGSSSCRTANGSATWIVVGSSGAERASSTVAPPSSSLAPQARRWPPEATTSSIRTTRSSLTEPVSRSRAKSAAGSLVPPSEHTDGIFRSNLRTSATRAPCTQASATANARTVVRFTPRKDRSDLLPGTGTNTNGRGKLRAVQVVRRHLAEPANHIFPIPIIKAMMLTTDPHRSVVTEPTPFDSRNKVMRIAIKASPLS